MNESTGFSASRFTGSIPAHYDHGMGPVIFAGHAQDLARRLARYLAPHSAQGRVLEVACGTGILTAALLEHLPPAVPLLASDLNPAMIGYAASRKPAGDRLNWLATDVRRLPLPDRVLEAAACQFGLMFVPDRAAALAEIRRALRPAGVLAFNVWHDFDHNPFARITRDTVAALLRGTPPAFLDVPFGWHDRQAIVALLERNGFEVCEVADLAGTAQAASARRFATGLIRGSPVSHEIEARGVTLDAAVDAVAAALAAEGGAEPWSGSMHAIAFIARRRD